MHTAWTSDILSAIEEYNNYEESLRYDYESEEE